MTQTRPHQPTDCTDDHPRDTQLMTSPECPACGEPAEAARQVGPITLVLDPCGHEIDDRVYRDLFAAGAS